MKVYQFFINMLSLSLKLWPPMVSLFGEVVAAGEENVWVQVRVVDPCKRNGIITRTVTEFCVNM